MRGHVTQQHKAHKRTSSLAIALLALVAACGGGGDAAPTPPTTTPAAVASVVVSLAKTTLAPGQNTAATAEARGADGAVLSGRAIAWSSSQNSVATVDGSGQVVAVAVGTANIIATSEGRSGSATLTVQIAPVAALVMLSDSIDVPMRTSATLVATTRDASGQTLTGRTISWQSSSPTTASVSATGVVTSLYPGTVTITATSEGRTATARVRGTLASLSAIIDSVRIATGMPAIGATIVSREGMIGIGVGGFRRITGGLPVTINDRWHIASDMKAITAMLAGMAVDAGVLSWDRTIDQAFPDLAATTRTEYKTVTLRELLSHVSGAINTNTGLSTATTNLPAVRTAWASYTFQQVPNNSRGQFYYSNNGFGVAGAIIERAWNSTFENLIATRIWQPLGITAAAWGPTTGVGGTDQPVGHQRVNNAWVVCEVCDNPAGGAPAGAMNISLAGWARIIQELMLADQGRSTLLSQANARVLTTNGVPAGGGATYAMGWQVAVNSPAGRLVLHDGSNGTNHARATVFLDGNMAFLIATNAADLAGGISASAMSGLYTRLNTYVNTGK